MSPTKGQVKRPGLAPGSLIHVGEARKEAVRIRLIEYSAADLKDTEAPGLESLIPLKPGRVSWINVDGIHQVEVVESAGRLLGLHPLLLEDVLNTRQRPKVEDYEGYLFLVLKMLTLGPVGGVASEQISLVLGPGYVLSFQEKAGDVFDPVRARLQDSKRRIRNRGADYLAYALLDSVVDHYFVILEQLGERILRVEAEVLEDPDAETLLEIHHLKGELILLRRSIWPLREVIGALLRDESELINQKTKVFLRDVYDHSIQIMDSIESLRDTVSGLLDIYLSIASNKMNEVMKVLTIIATIFIPLTFIAGIYGMNFEYMPELDQRWAYPAVWALMLGVASVMILYFRRKGWF